MASLDEKDSMGTVPTVSVIIPTYNDVDRLRLCLERLQDQDYPASRIEVIVADNDSTEDVGVAIPRDPRFRVVKEKRRGSYAARNAAVATATGDIFAFTDSDCLPRSNWISTGVAALLAEGAPDAIGGAINLVFRHGSKPTSGPELYEARHGFEQQKYIEKFGFAATANLFVSSDTFHAVGPFRADLKSGGDLNWGTRLTSSGRKLAYEPAAVIDHPSRPTWKDLTRKSLRVANGLADLASTRRTRSVVGRIAREARGGLTMWIRVWKDPLPLGPVDRIRYAAAFSYVSFLRSVIQSVRLVQRVAGKTGESHDGLGIAAPVVERAQQQGTVGSVT